MKTVWKFHLALTNQQQVAMPLGAELLAVQSQDPTSPSDGLQAWALVDPLEHIQEGRTFYIFGTGHRIEDHLRLKYVGTVQLHGGSLVFHVFEELK